MPERPDPLPDVTDAELTVLRELWEHGERTIRETSLAVYGDDAAASYATVQKLFERLEHKGIVERLREQSPHRFRPLVDRDGLVAARLRAMAERFCEGSLTPLLTGLLGQAPMRPEELDELRGLLDRLEEEAAARPRAAKKRRPKR